MRITIIGAGYVGLITAVSLADSGHSVTLLDINEEKINLINNEVIPFYEKGLKSILKKVLNTKKLFPKNFSIDNFNNPEIILICVGTPNIKGKISLKSIYEVAKDIGKWLKTNHNFCSVVIKSTVVPGTTDTYLRKILEKQSGLLHKNNRFGLGMNPEFLREGRALSDFQNSDRIVIGFEDDETKSRLIKLYKKFDCKKIFVNSRTAEMSKYVNNSLLALQISAINELANISNNIGNINFSKVLDAVKSDHRWTKKINNKFYSLSILDYLVPGPGYGGSCFPKDIKALATIAKQNDVKPRILNAIDTTNEYQPLFCFNHFYYKLKKNKKSKNVLFLGLTFKDNTDDLRESTSLKMIHYAKKKNLFVKCHDPYLDKDKLYNLKKIFVFDWTKYLDWADGIIISTSHKEYKKILKIALDRNKIIYDPRRFLYDQRKFIKSNYLTLG